MRPGLLSELVTIGYEIFLEGNRIKLRYRKPDDPPDEARPLIDELRSCRAEVLNILKASPDIARTVIVDPGANRKAVWLNPYPQGTSEAREISLSQVMLEIWAAAFDRIAAIWPIGFVSMPEIHAAEIEIEKVHALVLSNKAKIFDFHQAVEIWEHIVRQGMPREPNSEMEDTQHASGESQGNANKFFRA